MNVSTGSETKWRRRMMCTKFTSAYRVYQRAAVSKHAHAGSRARSTRARQETSIRQRGAYYGMRYAAGVGHQVYSSSAPRPVFPRCRRWPYSILGITQLDTTCFFDFFCTFLHLYHAGPDIHKRAKKCKNTRHACSLDFECC